MYFNLVPSSKNVLDRFSSTFQSKVKKFIHIFKDGTKLKILFFINSHLKIINKNIYFYFCYFRRFNVQIVQWNFQWKLCWNFIESKNMEPKQKFVPYVVQQFMADWICTWSQCTTRRKSFNVINVIIGKEF